mgnify:FL=1
MTDAEFMILRIFKAPRPVIERNPNLKMILRWGAGFDSVDIQQPESTAYASQTLREPTPEPFPSWPFS